MVISEPPRENPADLLQQFLSIKWNIALPLPIFELLLQVKCLLQSNNEKDDNSNSNTARRKNKGSGMFLSFSNNLNFITFIFKIFLFFENFIQCILQLYTTELPSHHLSSVVPPAPSLQVSIEWLSLDWPVAMFWHIFLILSDMRGPSPLWIPRQVVLGYVRKQTEHSQRS